jgi:glycine/serine hydroxymethyltransferase
MNTQLKIVDPEIHDLIQREKLRQFSGLELIASEVLSLSYVRTLLQPQSWKQMDHR